ncbi:beta strand repeat-containing protein, partial [Gellertiella hungarica]
MLDRDIDIHNNAAASGEESRVEGNAPAGIEVAQANQNPVFTDPATGSAVPADQAPAATPDGTRFAADQSNTVTLPEGVSIDKIVIQGKDIILVQADGTRIIITDGAVKVPTFLIGQVEVPQQTLVAALQANGINVAAGPDGTVSVVSTQSSGGNLSDGNGDIGDAGGVIGLLGNTDLVFGGATEEEVIAGIDPNDAPVFTSAAGIGSVTEILDGAPGENSTALTATGELRFTDADLQDSHSVSAIAGGAGYLGSFTPVITDSATGDGSGAVRWTFSVDDADLDYLAAGQTLTQTYTVTVTDGSGAVATQTVTVTLVGTNDAPVIISGPGAGSVTELADNAEGETVATLTTSGLLSFADVDDLDTHTVSAAPVGEGYLGTFTPVLADDSTGDNAGSIGWTFSVSDGALDFLAAGETRTQTYTVTVTDNNGATSSQTVTITLVGTNDAPIITSGPGEGSVKEYSYRGEEEWGSEGEWEGPREAAPMIHSTTGTLDFTDVDDIDTHTVSVTPNGEGYIGSFQPIITNTATGDNNGQISWTYTVQDGALDYLGAGQTRTQTYTVTVTDNNGASSSQTVTITLIGSNDRPIITGGQTSGSITELTDTDKLENNFDHPASGTLSFIDVDDVDTHTVSYYSLGSDYLGTFSVTLTDDSTGDNAGTVAWNFSVPDSAIDYLAAGQTLTQYYGVMVNDGKGGLTSQLVAVTITGTNDAPIITTGPVTESVKEIADGTEGENVDDLATNGTLAFTDVDDIDTHTVTFTPAGEKYLGDFSVSIGDDSTTDNTGTINWTFSVADADVDYLAVGETLTQTYTVTVRDNNGATSTQTVTITIVGTNDKPVITSGPDAGSVTEIADGQTGETTADLTATGSLAFSDVDLTNTHTVTHALTSVTGAAAALGTFEPTITNVATGDGTGTIGWTFKVNDGAIDYLAAGEKVTQVYT